jgi:hypothetical protein
LTPDDAQGSGHWELEGMRGIIEEGLQKSHSIMFRNQQAEIHRLQDAVFVENQKAVAAQQRLTSVEHQLAATAFELTLSKELAQTRAEELAVAQVFMSTGDRYCVTDVSRIVDKMNEAIDQCAGLIGRAFLQKKRRRGNRTAPRKWMTEKWGDYLTHRVLIDVDRGDGVLFESMLRNMFVVWCDDFISAVSGDPDQDEALKMLWGSISKLRE